MTAYIRAVLQTIDINRRRTHGPAALLAKRDYTTLRVPVKLRPVQGQERSQQWLGFTLQPGKKWL
jgi:hypothetical protein